MPTPRPACLVRVTTKNSHGRHIKPCACSWHALGLCSPRITLSGLRVPIAVRPDATTHHSLRPTLDAHRSLVVTHTLLANAQPAITSLWSPLHAAFASGLVVGAKKYCDTDNNPNTLPGDSAQSVDSVIAFAYAMDSIYRDAAQVRHAPCITSNCHASRTASFTHRHTYRGLMRP